MKKAGHILLLAALSPFLLVTGMGLAFFKFMEWSGNHSATLSKRTLLMLWLLPGTIGWSFGLAREFLNLQIGWWPTLALNIAFGLLAIYICFSLDRLETVIAAAFPNLSERQRRFCIRALIVINLPVILAIFPHGE